MSQLLSKASPIVTGKQQPSRITLQIQQAQQQQQLLQLQLLQQQQNYLSQSQTKKDGQGMKTNNDKGATNQGRSISPRHYNDGEFFFIQKNNKKDYQCTCGSCISCIGDQNASSSSNTGASSLLKQLPSAGRNNSQSQKQLTNSKKVRTDSQKNLKARLSQQNLSQNVAYLNNSSKKSVNNIMSPSQTAANWKGFHKSFVQASAAAYNTISDINKAIQQKNNNGNFNSHNPQSQVQNGLPFQHFHPSNPSSTSNKQLSKNGLKQDSLGIIQEFSSNLSQGQYSLLPLSATNKSSNGAFSGKQSQLINGTGSNFNLQSRGSGGSGRSGSQIIENNSQNSHQAFSSADDSQRRQNSSPKLQQHPHLQQQQIFQSQQRTPVVKTEASYRQNTMDNSHGAANKLLSYENNSNSLKQQEHLPLNYHSPLKINHKQNNHPYALNQPEYLLSNQEQVGSPSPLLLLGQSNLKEKKFDKQDSKGISSITSDSAHEVNEELIPLNKQRIQQLYMQQCWKKRVTTLDRALKEEDSDEEEDSIQDEIKARHMRGEKRQGDSDKTCQVNLKYQDQILHFEFKTKEKNVEWLFNYLMRRLYHHEREDLKHSDLQAREALRKIVSFVSSTMNMAVTYYLTQKKRLISVFNKKCINIIPLEFNEPEGWISGPGEYNEVGLSDFHLIRCIGMGGFSRVYLVQKKETGKMLALKLIDKKFILDNKKEGIVQNERNIMASIAHPFLLKLEYAFESKSYLGFTMEYCAGGELFYHLRRIERMPEDMARFYFVEICLGIDYLHKRHIIYRDIKPENILLDIDGHVRIGDFGLSKPDMDINELAHSFCGSPEYMAPEMLLKVGHTYPVDFYCLGALLYELVTGLPPFYSHDTDEIYSRILYEELEFPNHVQLSLELQNLLLGLLAKHPENRLGIKNGIRDILAHPWFKSIKIGDVLEKSLPPPLKPNQLGFNFDEQEFQNGEREFKKKLVNCQLGKDDEDLPTIFDDFYFDANLARLKKQKVTQRQQLQQQQQNQQSQKYLHVINSQQQTNQGYQNKIQPIIIGQPSVSPINSNGQFFSSPNQKSEQNLFQNQQSNLKQMSSQKHKQPEGVIQRKGSHQTQNTISKGTTNRDSSSQKDQSISSSNQNNIQTEPSENALRSNLNYTNQSSGINSASRLQSEPSPHSSQNGNFRLSSDNFKMIGDNFKTFGEKFNQIAAAANQNTIAGNLPAYIQLLNQNFNKNLNGKNNENNQSNKPTHLKQSNSLGIRQQQQQQQQHQQKQLLLQQQQQQQQQNQSSLSSGKKNQNQLQLHLKANSAVKLQTNNFISTPQNQWGRQSHQMIGATNTSSTPLSTSHLQNNNTSNSKIYSNQKKMRTEEDQQEMQNISSNHNLQDDESGSNRMLTDINRRSRALLKINGSKNSSLPKTTTKHHQQIQQHILTKQQSNININNNNSSIMSTFTPNGGNSNNSNIVNKLLSNRQHLPYQNEQQQLNQNHQQYQSPNHANSVSPSNNNLQQTKHYNPIDFIYRN